MEAEGLAKLHIAIPLEATEALQVLDPITLAQSLAAAMVMQEAREAAEPEGLAAAEVLKDMGTAVEEAVAGVAVTELVAAAGVALVVTAVNLRMGMEEMAEGAQMESLLLCGKE